MDMVEEGLRLFVLERASKSTVHEICGYFAITSSDGNRFYAFCRSFDCRVFISISTYPTIDFSRQLFELLQFEPVDDIPHILSILCTFPIVPAAGVAYNIHLSRGIARLQFTSCEQVEDIPLDMVVLSVMTPHMLVRAWEAIILERKVVVISSIDSLISACCEYIRRLALPLAVVNTFVPLLPPELIHTVEAPFPYLVGANSITLRENITDMSEIVVIDLVRYLKLYCVFVSLLTLFIISLQRTLEQ